MTADLRTSKPAQHRPDLQGLMVMCAPNGARRVKSDHAALPVTPSELARACGALAREGVSVLHLHVRDDDGRHTLSPRAYRAAIDAIESAVGDALVIQVTTEAAGRYSPAEQMKTVQDLKPEAVSLALREFIPDRSEPESALNFFREVADMGCWAQYIVYSPEELIYLDALRKSGSLGLMRPSCLLVLGSYLNSRNGSLPELEAFLATGLLTEFSWAACCFGPTEKDVLLTAAHAGGHVRLGFENNIELREGTRAQSNAELISGFLSEWNEPGRPVVSAREIRHSFCIQGHRVPKLRLDN